MKLDETRLASESVFDGILLKVRRDAVRLPDGQTAVREWIDHPGAAAVVPLLTDGTTLLVRQFRYAARRAFLEVPAGKLDAPGEAPAAVARRELEEETGYRAGRLHDLGALYPAIGYSNERIHVFLAEDLVAGRQQLGREEFVEIVRLPLVEAVARARRGEIDDMKTVAALWKASAFLAARP